MVRTRMGGRIMGRGEYTPDRAQKYSPQDPLTAPDMGAEGVLVRKLAPYTEGKERPGGDSRWEGGRLNNY